LAGPADIDGYCLEMDSLNTNHDFYHQNYFTMLNDRLLSLPGITVEEKTALEEILRTLDSDEKRNSFITFYSSNRRDPMLVLICTCVGFFGVAGIQRILVGQVLMGIIYFFTAGLCFIGTIYDIINYKSLTSEYNIQKAREGYLMVK
jgi:TM2 domain-containing membrane protein YozV